MKKSKILLIFLTGFVAMFTFWSCATTEVEPAEKQSEEVVLREPQEPQDGAKESQDGV